MNSHITRQEALELLRKYNKEPFHLQHAKTVAYVMECSMHSRWRR